MKKYQFPLQAILTLRALKQEQALEVYAKSVQECATRRTQMISATHRADNLERLIAVDGDNRFSPSMRHAYMKALEVAREEVTHCEKSLSEAEQTKETHLTEFLDRKRKKEILEHLREKQFKEHLSEGYRKEEIEIEDLVISRRSIARIA